MSEREGGIDIFIASIILIASLCVICLNLDFYLQTKNRRTIGEEILSTLGAYYCAQRILLSLTK